MPALVQDLPGQVPDVELVAVAEVAATGLGGVVQQRLGGKVREGDALAGQRTGDVETGAAPVVRRGLLGLHQPHEPVELRVGLGRLEMLVVADEAVAPERRQRRSDHPQAAQQHQRMRDLAAGPVGVGEFAHRPIGDVEPRREPPLLPGRAGELGHQVEQPSHPAPPVVGPLRLARPHLLDDGHDLLNRRGIEIAVRSRRHRRGRGGCRGDDLPRRCRTARPRLGVRDEQPLLGVAPQITHRTPSGNRRRHSPA